MTGVWRDEDYRLEFMRVSKKYVRSKMSELGMEEVHVGEWREICAVAALSRLDKNYTSMLQRMQEMDDGKLQQRSKDRFGHWSKFLKEAVRLWEEVTGEL